MGGLGRTIMAAMPSNPRHGRRRNADGVGPSWEELAALPESYATAWTCLFRNLELVRARHCSFAAPRRRSGRAALNMAVDAGAKVYRHDPQQRSIQSAEDLGAHRVSWKGESFNAHCRGQADRLDSRPCRKQRDPRFSPDLRRGGRACLAGWRRPSSNRELQPLLQMASGSTSLFWQLRLWYARAFLFQMFRSRRSRRRWSKAGSTRNLHEYSASKTFVRHIA